MFNTYTKLIVPRDYSPVYSHFSSVDSLIDEIFDNAIYSANRSFSIDENDNAYVITIQLPGYKQSHLDITVEQDVMTVKATKDKSSFSRSFVLPKGVDLDKIAAKLEDGILEINLPKSLNAKARKVTVQ